MENLDERVTWGQAVANVYLPQGPFRTLPAVSEGYIRGNPPLDPQRADSARKTPSRTLSPAPTTEPRLNATDTSTDRGLSPDARSSMSWDGCHLPRKPHRLAFDEFCSLSVNQLTEIIGHDELDVEEETTVWEAVVRWVQHHREDRLHHLPSILPHIRFNLLTLDDTAAILEHILVREDPGSSKVIRKVIRKVRKGEVNLKPRLGMTTEMVFLSNVANNEMLFLNPREGKYISCNCEDFPDSAAITVTRNNDMYVLEHDREDVPYTSQFSRYTNELSMFKYNHAENEWVHAAVAMGTEIFCTDRDFTQTLVYDSELDCWQKLQGWSNPGNRVQPSPDKFTHWKLTNVQYDGVPFQLVAKKGYSCHQGKDKHLKDKQKYQAQKDAKMIPEDTQGHRRAASLALKAALKSNSAAVQAVMEFHTQFPEITEHKYHPVVGEAAELRLSVEGIVKKHITKLTQDGARRLSEVKRHLKTFVNDELFRGKPPPPLTDRRYNPTDQDIRNIMSKAKRPTGTSKDDQVNLQTLAARWERETDCHVKYRPSQEEEDGSTTRFLFCYQTAWQQRLLNKYGNQMCLLDATYRTCRYDVPLFFLCVRTNVCYAVVGTFVILKEATVDVQEALQVFKEWNPNWTPSHFMVDKSDVEINALEEEFPEAKVLLCDFHREEAWVEWCRKTENGVRKKQDEVLNLLRAIASASTQEEYVTRKNQLEESEVWKGNEKLQTWLSRHWIPEAKRWVHFFRAEDLKVAIYTNNGIERQNESLKYGHLEGFKNSPISEMLTRVVTSFLPETHRKYIELNVRYSEGYSVYSSKLQPFLKNRPRDMVLHIQARYNEAQVYNTDDIIDTGDGLFRVASQRHPGTYYCIDFGQNIRMPSCTCKDWGKFKLPCKHFCAIFHNVPGWGWERLTSLYRDNPIFTLDERYLTYTPAEDSQDNNDDDGATASHIDFTPVDEVRTSTISLPGRKKSKKTTLTRQCAGVIQEINNLVHLLHDVEYIEFLKNQLEDILEDVRGHTPHDGAFPVIMTTPKKMEEVSSQMPGGTKRTAEMANLPRYKAPNKKHPFTNRVGFQAEMMRANFQVRNLNVDNDDEQDSLPMSTVIDLTVEDHDTEENTVPHLPPRPDDEWVTINRTTLTEKDREKLQVGQWLTDKHIYCAQHLLKEEYYQVVDGFQDTFDLASDKESQHVPALTECVQLHHIGDHWVVSSSPEGDTSITVYDSLSLALGISLRKQLVKLYKDNASAIEGELPVKVICAQKQAGSSDCGVYAIANAVALCEGRSPTDIVFEQPKMREHLERCFTTKSLQMFPHEASAGLEDLNERMYYLSVFCICNLHRKNVPMIMCDQCQNWFHYKCVKITASDVAELAAEDKYICPTCKRA
ncbi:KLHL41 [Branchiostoma lanceolatum]|uniref:KLHL41 protein n=1 Tax=Branchiostoma lanceolatum TaxID=7740 RepID=A0A8K0A6A6_BRALA|nr:KLHL41 [Branchiostoma lanceolatum]